MKKVILMPYELADAYALKTLYEYLNPLSTDKNFTIAFLQRSYHKSIERLLYGTDHSLDDDADLYVTCYSDIQQSPYMPAHSAHSLNVDICLLKNAVIPLSENEKAALREKYRLPLKQPLSVISYVHFVESEGIQQLVKALSKHSLVCLVGNFPPIDLTESALGFRPVTEFGVLKDYYAMADLAINAENLQIHFCNMHNFVEATEGGPLFIVKPGSTSQYGYKELVSVGAIQECSDLDEIISKSLNHLRNPCSNAGIQKARNRHLAQTREKYLPAIYNSICYLLSLTPGLSVADLYYTSGLSVADLNYKKFEDWKLPNQKKLNLWHPDTRW